MAETKKSADEQKERLQKYFQRFRKARDAVSKKQDTWTELDTFDRGEQWEGAPIPPWVPKPVTNYVRYVRTLKRANLASSIPKPNFTPLIPTYKDLVFDRLTPAFEHVWNTEKIPRLVRRVIDRAVLQGTAIAYVYDDDTYVGGEYYGQGNFKNALFQGKICVRRFPNANFFPDPDAYRITDCKYVETTELLRLSNVKNMKAFQDYAGDKLAKVKINAPAQDDGGDGTIFNRDNKPNQSNPAIQGDEMVTLHTHWERYLNDDNQWRLDVTYYLREAMDFELLRLEDVKPAVYPFAVLYDEEEENDFWGRSQIMDFWENQKIINKVDQTASIIATLNQNPQKVVAKESGINAQELARTGTLPGKVWVSNTDPTKSVHTIQPPEIPKSLFDMKDRLVADVKEMVGVNEAYTGQSVGSLTTSTGVNSLIERATIRDKDKMMQIDEFVEQLSTVIMQMIIHKWKDKRPVVSVGPDGDPSYTDFEPLTQDEIDNIDWIVKSDVYARAPMTQSSRKQQADNLMQMQGQFNFNPPLITPEEWARLQDFDFINEMMRRMKADRAQMEAEKAQNMAQAMVQVAQVIQQHMSEGQPPQVAQQIAMQFAQQLVDQQKQAEMQGKSAPMAQPGGPQGTTGMQAMSAMTKGM